MQTATRPSQGSLLTTLILAITAYQLTFTMTLPALPAITKGLGGDPGAIGLAQALSALAGALATVFLPLSDRFGRRNALLAALLACVVGSLLCAIAPGPGMFTVGRVLQGFSVIAMPLSNILTHRHLPAERFGRALGLLNMVNLGISGADTILAGWLADTYGFRAIFWIMLVVQAVTVVTVARLLPADEPDRQIRPDWAGMTTLALGVLALLTAVSNSSTWGWGSSQTLGLLATGLALLAGFVLVEKRSPQPMIQVGHLRSRRTWPLLLVPIFAMGALAGLTAFALPLFGQNPDAGLGLSALEYALLCSIPASVLSFACAPFAGVIAPKVGWRRLLLIGLVGMAAGMVVLTTFLPVLWAVVISTALLGALFSGFASTAANGLAVLLSPAENPSFLPAMMSCAFSIGAALGISTAVSVLTGLGGTSQSAFVVTVGVLAVFSVLSVLAGALVPDPSRKKVTA